VLKNIGIRGYLQNPESGVLPLDDLPSVARKKTNRTAFPMIGTATILHI